jgi:hypothetical protein
MQGGAMKKLVTGLLLVLLANGMLAHADLPEWQVTPSVQKVSTKSVDITVTPILTERYGIEVGYTGMLLEVQNKTNRDVVINWGETFYLMAGVPNGGFTLKGAQGTPQKGFDIILSGETYVKTIYPVALLNVGDISRLSDLQLDSMHKPMPIGENGIDIKVRVGFEAVQEKLTFKVSGKNPL